VYSYCYVCSILCILFHCVVLCTICVQMCSLFLYQILSYSLVPFLSVFTSVYIYIYMYMIVLFCMLLFNIVNYVFYYCYVYVFWLVCVFLLLYKYMLHSLYSVSLCCSVYCLCVNVYCTTATGCQPNCSKQTYHIIYHIISYIIDDKFWGGLRGCKKLQEPHNFLARRPDPFNQSIPHLFRITQRSRTAKVRYGPWHF
jgi:hypothetical protein